MIRLRKIQRQLLSITMKSQITYLNQKEAFDSDQDLMSPNVGYTLDMLMELAGQSACHCLHHINGKYEQDKIKKVLFICGPGNNGGDGIVAARHLSHYNGQYTPTILMTRAATNKFFVNQLNICRAYSIPIKELAQEIDLSPEKQKEETITKISDLLDQYDLIVDAIFGFSYQPPCKHPVNLVLDALKQTQTPIFSIDIPSGWDVEKGNIYDAFNPQYLISLTLPKEGSRFFKGIHFVGGRFVPHQISHKYKWNMPIYKDNQTFIQLNE